MAGPHLASSPAKTALVRSVLMSVRQAAFNTTKFVNASSIVTVGSGLIEGTDMSIV